MVSNWWSGFAAFFSLRSRSGVGFAMRTEMVCLDCRVASNSIPHRKQKAIIGPRVKIWSTNGPHGGPYMAEYLADREFSTVYPGAPDDETIRCTDLTPTR